MTQLQLSEPDILPSVLHSCRGGREGTCKGRQVQDRHGGGKQKPILPSLRESASANCCGVILCASFGTTFQRWWHERTLLLTTRQQQQPPPPRPLRTPQQQTSRRTTSTSRATNKTKSREGKIWQHTHTHTRARARLISAPLTSRLALCTSRCLSSLLCTYETTCWLETRSHTPSHAKIKNASSGWTGT